MKIAVDWSHTKGLATYDGHKVKLEKDRKSLLESLKNLVNRAHQPMNDPGSVSTMDSVTVILEEGCPPSLIYDLVVQGNQVRLISNRATQRYRVEHAIAKSDENDARIIWELAKNEANLRPAPMDDNRLHLHSLYKQYYRYQKARVAMNNMKTAYLRYFGPEKPGALSTLSADTAPYDTAIETLKAKERSVMKQLTRLVSAGESSSVPSRPPINGLGDGLWAAIVVTANPNDFKCLSAYLRFCGLTQDVRKSRKFNRRAKWAYHMLARFVTQFDDPRFRPVYDKCKADITEKHRDYDKTRIHYAALNRTATMLAKEMFRHFKTRVLEAGE